MTPLRGRPLPSAPFFSYWESKDVYIQKYGSRLRDGRCVGIGFGGFCALVFVPVPVVVVVLRFYFCLAAPALSFLW